MHVSSKMVFHLADSFYYALKNVDAVAIEINPAIWQKEMVNLDRLQHNYKNFIQATPNDYLNEKSFQLENYEDKLREALQSEPTVVNNLLYRSYKSKEDFEEDTFLDLYIYQTAKKLGKITTGVEDYFSTEKMVLEAYTDMAKEKKKGNAATNESLYEIEKKVEDAYRRGDLDLLDSLENILEGSKAFREKFLLKRNEIQANSIDTILKKNSLFAGVGAAHLPGDRGVTDNGYNEMDSVQFVSSTTVDYDGSKGFVYFFKYRMKEEDEWKMGISGVQPLNKNEINTGGGLTKLTDKKINNEKELNVQFQNELKKMLILSHKSGRNYYLNDNYNPYDNE
jgi:uncharacterized protein YbaP (TraB family)